LKPGKSSELSTARYSPQVDQLTIGVNIKQGELKMEIKIKGNAHEIYAARVNCGHYMSLNSEWYDKLRAVAGKTLVVETKHLFKDQFNTAPVPGVSELGLRIMVESVEEVIDDEREYMLRCAYCGQMSEVGYVDSLRCPHCNQGDYLVPLSNEAKVSWDYKMRAKAERSAGGHCRVNSYLSEVSIRMSDGSEYYLQGEEAENMIAEYRDIEWLSCEIEDYLLAIAQSW